MITSEKLDFYVRYKGNWENWLRSPEGIRSLRVQEPSLLDDDEWTFISETVHDLYLIKNRLADKSFSMRLETALLSSCEDASIIDRLKELIPYQYGLWDKKSSLSLCIGRVFRLFS